MSPHRLVLHRRPARLAAGLLLLLFVLLRPSCAWSQSPAPAARSSGAYLVKDIMGSGLSGTASANVDHLVATEDYLFFSAETAVQAETGYPHLGLWRSDGTLEGTGQIAVYSMPEQPFELSLRVVNGTAVFLAPLGGGGSELFRSSSDPGLTFLLGDIRPGPESSNPTDFVRVGNLLYFIAGDGRHGEELWATDLTGPFVIHHTYLPALRR